MIRVFTYISFSLIFLTGCGDSNQQIQEDDDVENFIRESENYMKNRDFDGDNISDDLLFTYTEGAHCCYIMSLKLSSKQDTIHYPFEMDGGYEFGIVDGSQHNQFEIGDLDGDGLPEIFMTISTYNGEEYSIDSNWTIQYGITSNYIIFDYRNGEIVLDDYDPEKYPVKKK
ncbi:MAG: hypothetical protein KDD41_07545 [Flavobacteriales bacterium]|nr:hypothetical protein [Flavobacteriales bacterium]